MQSRHCTYALSHEVFCVRMQQLQTPPMRACMHHVFSACVLNSNTCAETPVCCPYAYRPNKLVACVLCCRLCTCDLSICISAHTLNAGTHVVETKYMTALNHRSRWCFLYVRLDGVSPSVFRCTSIPMETGPIVTCGET